MIKVYNKKSILGFEEMGQKNQRYEYVGLSKSS